jgi:predicted AlkP superfamily phosphohydrolase/phosphomutase
MLLKKGKITSSTPIIEDQIIEKDIYEVVKVLFKAENKLLDFYRVRLRQWLINNEYLKITTRYPVLKCEATAFGRENGISTVDEKNSDKTTIILFNEFAIALLIENIERINNL